MLTTILVGSSGSGKSAHAQTLGQVICSTDKYVEEQARILGVSYDNSLLIIKFKKDGIINHTSSSFFPQANYEDYSLIDTHLLQSWHQYRLIFLKQKQELQFLDQPFCELILGTAQAHTCF
jgi:ABC-type dipeptide/oligopeptide/nickel transport system ATPase component